MSYKKRAINHDLSTGAYELIERGANRPMTFQIDYEDVANGSLKAYLSADASGPWKEIPDTSKSLTAGDNNEFMQLSGVGYAFIKFSVSGTAGTIKTAQLLS